MSKKSVVMILMGFFVLLLSMVEVVAEEQLYDDSITPKQYVDVLSTLKESAFWINYNDSKEIFTFYSNETMGPIAFEANTVFIDSMIGIIDKYKEWNIKASSKGIKLDKEISKLRTGKTYWKWGDEWNSSRTTEISFSFFSQTAQKHQLVLVFDKFISYQSASYGHKPEALYFDYREAMKLKKIFSKGKLEQHLNRISKKKAIEDEFK